jgi:hypothetical protein
MGVYEGRGQLAKAIKQLMGQWNEVKQGWDDPLSHAMEKEHLVPLEIDLRNAVSALDHIAQVLATARRDCGD